MTRRERRCDREPTGVHRPCRGVEDRGGLIVSFEFLAVDGAIRVGRHAPIAHSPMEGQARSAGARFEQRDGWNVAVGYADPVVEHAATETGGAWTDSSHLGKIELQSAPATLGEIVVRACGGAGGSDAGALQLGLATRAAGAWWCPLTPDRALAICPASQTAPLRERVEEAARANSGHASVIEVTTLHAAITLSGPLAREMFARFCALDLRPQSTPVRGVRPGSVARTPGLVLREAEDRFLMLFGWALGEYMWSVVEDAGARLGARPVGVDALAPLDTAAQEPSTDA
jgi:heterotetrameric sarcosine oxidase gamma subunit